MRWLLVLCALAGCRRITSSGVGGDAGPNLAITIEQRPDVRGTASLAIRWKSGDTTLQDSVSAPYDQFPLVYEIENTGQSGQVDITVDALDISGNLVGHGAVTASYAAGRARVQIEGADFVVNSVFPGSQFLTNEGKDAGLQVAAVNDHTWAVVFRDDCDSCNILARRFDTTGLAVPGALTVGTQQFAVNTSETTGGAVPAIAADATHVGPDNNDHAMVVVWDHLAPDQTSRGVACRAMSELNLPTPTQLLLANEDVDGVAVSAIGNGLFAVTWLMPGVPQLLRAAIVRRDCTIVGSSMNVSAGIPGQNAYGAHVAANTDTLLYVWFVDGEVYARVGGATGGLGAPETKLVAKSGTRYLEYVRVVPWGNGFAVAARSIDTSSGIEEIAIYRVSTAGVVVGGPYSVSRLPGANVLSNHAFGLAARNDGRILVAWHTCTGLATCEVLGQFVEPSGEVIARLRVLPTTTSRDQTDPSVAAVGDVFVAAWTDTSMSAPDLSGSAVRARIIYPPAP